MILSSSSLLKQLFIGNFTQYFIHLRSIHPSNTISSTRARSDNISKWGVKLPLVRFLRSQNKKLKTESSKVGLDWFESVLNQTRQSQIPFQFRLSISSILSKHLTPLNIATFASLLMSTIITTCIFKFTLDMRSEESYTLYTFRYKLTY